MFISCPSIVSAFGGGEELFEALKNCERKFAAKLIFGKEFLVSEVAYELPEFPGKIGEIYKTRTNRILLAAILGLKGEIDKAVRKYGKDRVGAVIGTTTTGVEENLRAFEGEKFDTAEFKIDRNSLCNPAEFAREFLGLKGVALGISTACTSGIKVFDSAINLINLGVCDAVVTGGVDSLNSLTLLGFNSLGVLSNKPCMPFDTNREGINIGEGAGLFVLSKDEISPFRIKAVAGNADAFHITQPDPNANMQIRLIKELLRRTNLRDTDFISLHATGTLANDAMEARAVAQTLPSTLCSGIKANIGHTLAAAGAIEAGVCVLAMEQSVAPMQIISDFDQNLQPLNLVLENERKEIKNCLNLSFAFGGDNAAMIIGNTGE